MDETTTEPTPDAATDAATDATDAMAPTDSATDAAADAPGGEAGEPGTPSEQDLTTSETGELGPDPLASLEDDSGAVLLGTLPIILIALLAGGAIILYLVRRKKSWHELDEALKIDEGDTPVGDEAFTTRDMQEMEPTRPSERVSDDKES